MKISKSTPQLQIKRVGENNLPLPSRGTEESAGFDLSCSSGFSIGPGERKMIKTGFIWCIPSPFMGIIKSRSGLALKHGIDVKAGVIDSDFRGELRVIMQNQGSETMIFEGGDRIAQMVLVRVPPFELILIDEVDSTERGEGGFGSTGS
ncbi:MAG: dUTP diphosphatase [Actinomycetia bacterium]|nr:dUTP diphosphatase [Actinomycetes bacterium]